MMVPMNITRRAPLVTALVAALVGLSAAPGVAADVSPQSTNQCGASAFCVWSAAGYSGSFRQTTSTSAVAVSFSPVASVWNRSSHAARIYSGSGGTGSSVCYAPGAQVTGVHVTSASMRVLSTTSC
jgi:hypothetical protein